MLEVYTGKRGSAVTVVNSATAAATYQEELMAAGMGWFRVCYADGAITIAPLGLMPLTFETEDTLDLGAIQLSDKQQTKSTPDDFNLFAQEKELSKFHD